MTDTELLFMSATKAAALIRRKKLSPVEYVEAALSAADRLQPKLNCFMTITAEQAREAGIVNKVVDAALVDAVALQAAREIAALPAGAVAVSRRLMRGHLDAVVRQIDTEVMHFKDRLQSDEARAAFSAFLSRKK